VKIETHKLERQMETRKLKNGDACAVIGGTHKGKSGIVQDLKTSKTGHITITVVQNNGVRFKTLARNVVVKE
jgi:ribosomal protein S4E